MTIIEMDYINVSERAAQLGCPVPEIAILPENFTLARSCRELRMRSHAIGLRSVLEGASFPLGRFCDAAEHATFREEDYAHWDATLFISGAILTREPYVIGIALSIIRAHLAEYFQDQPGRLARLILIVERKSDRQCKKLVYEGEIAGLRTLAERANKIGAE